MSYKTMKVGDLMSTALITMHSHSTVSRADAEMKFAAIRHIPIVDERNRLVGMVSNRDILRAIGAEGKSEVKVSGIMTKRVHTISEDAPAHEAAALLLEHKIGALPVLSEGQELVGVITETDFVRFAHGVLGGESYD